jgi:hypothetical protein
MKVYTKDEVQQLAWWAVTHASKLIGEDRNRVIHRHEIDDYLGQEMPPAYGKEPIEYIVSDPGLTAIVDERYEQLTVHGRTVERDIEINTWHQLSFIAMMLIHVDYDREHNPNFDEDEYIAMYCPTDWNKEVFRHMLRKPFVERIAVSGALLAAEISRYKASGDTSTPYSVVYKPDETIEVDLKIREDAPSVEEFFDELEKKQKEKE